MRPSFNNSRDSKGKSDSLNATGQPARRMKKRPCRFCADRQLPMDYKEPKILLPFLTERGKIIPRRVTGNCAVHQRRLQQSIKRARILALIPFNAQFQL